MSGSDTVLQAIWTIVVLAFVWFVGGPTATIWSFFFYLWLIPSVLIVAAIGAGCWIWRGFKP